MFIMDRHREVHETRDIFGEPPSRNFYEARGNPDGSGAQVSRWVLRIAPFAVGKY